jgi:dipeptidyl aminopeptidase/acylaminoacyl peptidase
MKRRDDERVRAALRDAPAPGEGQAEDRGWAVVREAFTERELVPQPMRLRARAGLAVLGAAAVAVVALTPAGADVREWIADAVEIGEEDARPALGTLPAPGAILTQSPEGAWILRDDGSRRRLGDYDHATWSPNGLYVGVSDGRDLFAVTTTGERRWSVRAPARIAAIDWSSDDGFRVAYVAGDELRIVAGDGTPAGGPTVAEEVASPAIAWRPESLPAAVHELTYVDADGRVVLTNTETGEVLWRSQPVPAPVESLQWAADGERLLVAADGFATLLDARGNGLFKGPVATGTAATLSPDGQWIAAVRPGGAGDTELVLIPASLAEARERVLYPTSPGKAGVGFGAPTFSPDGEWILLPWPEADQWLFIRVSDRRVVPVGDISRQLDANGRGPGSFPEVAGWCCS